MVMDFDNIGRNELIGRILLAGELTSYWFPCCEGDGLISSAGDFIRKLHCGNFDGWRKFTKLHELFAIEVSKEHERKSSFHWGCSQGSRKKFLLSLLNFFFEILEPSTIFKSWKAKLNFKLRQIFTVFPRNIIEGWFWEFCVFLSKPYVNLANRKNPKATRGYIPGEDCSGKSQKPKSNSRIYFGGRL